ncbi:MAG TPA: PilZ domain-containing protein [Anaerolineaceae bacterium]|nr:PilZ domain-containing protein [Anaerolineaceae bacterium]
MLSPNASDFFDIQQTLIGLAEKGEKVEMTTIYKGVFLSQRVSHIEFKKDRVQFMPPHQICCVKPELQIYIHHDSLLKSVVTSVAAMDLATGLVTSTHLSYIDHCWKQRKGDRVQPKQPLRAVLSIAHWSISASIADISVNGIGLLIYGMANKGLNIQVKQSIQTGLRLPGSKMPLALSGRIARIDQLGNSAMISLGIETYPNDKQAHQLKSYISGRQTEILEEMSQIVRYSLEPAQTKDLFF